MHCVQVAHGTQNVENSFVLSCNALKNPLGWAGLDSNLLPPGHALYYISSLCCKGEMMLCKRRMSQAQGRGAEDINQIETLFVVNQFIIL